MMAHDPSLVILSTTIAILGAFTACVMTSNLAALGPNEGRMRLLMAAITLGGSIWASHFVGLLSLDVPVNFANNPVMLAASAAVAFAGTAIALFLLRARDGSDPVRLPLGVAVFGVTIAATNYFGIAAVAGYGLRLSWFLTVVTVAMAIQVAAILQWFLFRPRGVVITLLGAIGLGLALSAVHYLSIASGQGLADTLLAVPQSANGVSERYLAWAATIMMYLVCSICLCVFVIMQFREEME